MSGRAQLPSGLVTFMFTDIEGSTRLARMLGAGYHPVLDDHRTLLRRSLSDFDGAELFTEGDSFFVAFTDAAAALTAALDAQRALAGHPWPTPDTRPRVRMGLHTGYAIPVGREYASAEVHRAARIAAAAHGGQVLCSAATARHAVDALPAAVELLDLGGHRLRGFDDVERLFQLVAPGLERTFPCPRTARAALHNLPSQVTGFVGRRAERREVRALLDQHRLVTVVAMGGSGKTRLAVQVAADLVDAYPDGVWFIDVAAVAEPAELPAAVAMALGLRPEPGRPVLTTVIEYLAQRRVLLVVDTCDAFPRATADLMVGLLTGGPGVRVLATSREPLTVPGELVWRLPSMAVSARAGEAPADAVALLLDRAAAARGGRACASEELAALDRIVARLDGLPLAIELAAARLRLLSAAQLADRLDDTLGALDVGSDPRPGESGSGETARHASLRATVGWSYRTLGPRAAGLLRRLAVFAGPVDLPTIEWRSTDDVLTPLSVLVDKSLLQVVAHRGSPRYRLVEPVRAYALRRLVESGEEAGVREEHVNWCLDVLRRTRLDPDGRPRTLSVRFLDTVADELLAAVRWCATEGGPRRGLRLAEGLGPWWQERGRSAEARGWFHRLYGRLAASGQRLDEAELAVANLAHAEYAVSADERVRFLQRAETAARRADDPGLLIRAVAGRSLSMLESGRLVEAERMCRVVIEQADRLRVPAAAFPAIIGLAELLWRRGALSEVSEVLGAARPAELGRPQDRGRRTVDMLLGMVALRRGDLVAAHDHLVVALRSRMRYGFYAPAAETVGALAVRCAIGADPGTAALLFGAADSKRAMTADPKRAHARRAEPSLRAEPGLRAEPSLRAESGRPGLFAGFWVGQQASLRAAIGDAAFDAAYADGTRLTLEQAAAVALAVEHPDLAVGSTRFGADAHLRQ